MSEAAPRNIVVCCDGTGNTWSKSGDTNVVRLFRDLVKQDQTVFYDPGVGTASNFPGVDFRQRAANTLTRITGLAQGVGIYENIADAYLFLMRNARPQDRIYVFGFSRGAFTARAVAGMVHLFGLIRGASDNLVPMLVRIYFSRTTAKVTRIDAAGHKSVIPMRDALAEDIRNNFCDAGAYEQRVHFVGVWDTVESVGGLFGLRATISSSPTITGKRIDHVRQALSLDETRWTFLPRLYGEADFADEAAGKSLSQVWFPGVHADVGGGYGSNAAASGTAVSDGSGGLSHAPMRWVLEEAERLGLELNSGWRSVLPVEPHALLHDEVFHSPYWALAGLRRREWPPSGVRGPATLDVSVQQRAANSGTAYRPMALLGSSPEYRATAPFDQSPLSTGANPAPATPAHVNSTVWKPLFERRIFWMLLVLTPAWWIWISWLGVDAMGQLAYGISYPLPDWSESLRRAVPLLTIESAPLVLLLDFLFIPVYGLFLGLLSSHAWRALVRHAHTPRADTILLCLSLLPAVALASDSVQNVAQGILLRCVERLPILCLMFDRVAFIATACRNVALVAIAVYLLAGCLASLAGITRRRRA